jgi:teichuronic acid biosynthesis glycosyltransferase TuaG
MAKIFITLLTHNNGAFIESSIKSVLNQTFQDWKMLISDDASSDNTYDTLKHLLNDHIIEYVYHKYNLKQPKNWEYALKQNDAQIIATLHADDEWTRNALAEVVGVFENNKSCDLVWGNWEFFDMDFKPLNKIGPVKLKRSFNNSNKVLEYLGRNNETLPSATFISKRILETTGYPNDSLKMLCDREFYLRILNNVRYAESIPSIVCKYRINQEGVSSTFKKNYTLYNEILSFALNLNHLIDDFPLKSKLISAMKNDLCIILIQGAVDAKKNKNIKMSKELIVYAKKIDSNFRLSLKSRLKLFLA